MLKQQEVSQRFPTSSVLQPASAGPMKILNKPKDLTSTLLESNLSQLKLTHSSDKSNILNNNPTFQPMSMQYGNMNNNFSSFDNRMNSMPNSRSSNTLNMNSLLSSTERRTALPQSNSNSLLLQHSTNYSTSQSTSNKNNNKGIDLSHDDILEFLK